MLVDGPECLESLGFPSAVSRGSPERKSLLVLFDRCLLGFLGALLAKNFSLRKRLLGFDATAVLGCGRSPFFDLYFVPPRCRLFGCRPHLDSVFSRMLCHQENRHRAFPSVTALYLDNLLAIRSKQRHYRVDALWSHHRLHVLVRL